MEIELIISIVTGVTFVASAIAALLPTPPPESKWYKVHKVIEFAALNIGKVRANTTVGKIGSAVEAVKILKDAVKKDKDDDEKKK